MNLIVWPVDLLFNLYLLGLIVMVVASWAQHPVAYGIRRRLEPFYDPFLKPIRGLLRPFQAGTTPIDFSPLALFIGVLIVRELVVSLLDRIF